LRLCRGKQRGLNPYIQKQQLLNWDIENYSWENWSNTVAMYYGIISQTDDAIGRVINTLEELGLRENTIIVYTTDHGAVSNIWMKNQLLGSKKL
jgi:arylsulfatase A-like enzyme